MSDKSDTPRTDERCAAIMAWQAKESDWPDFARQLERELAAVTEERDALAAAMPSEGADAALAYAAEKTLREKAEAECERLRHAVDLAARAMHGEGVDDQAQAWDVCLRILDAARADFPEEK